MISFSAANLRILATITYSLSFIAIFFVIVIQRKDIAKFGLTDQFIWLALYGLIHGLADISVLVVPLFTLAEPAIFSTGRLVVKATSYLFLLYFGASELIRPAKKTTTFLLALVFLPLIVAYLVTWGELHWTFRFVALFIGFPSALIAGAGSYHLALKFRPVHLPILPTGFFVLGSFFLLYAVSKVTPVYSVYPEITAIGQYVLIGRALVALGICVTTWSILRAFTK